MVGVQIAPTHPLSDRHVAEDRMGVTTDSAIRDAEAFNGAGKRGAVGGEFGRGCSSHPLLDFRPRPNALGPRSGHVQRDPLHHRPLKETGRGRNSLLAERCQEGVVEMADHLRRSHSAP